MGPGARCARPDLGRSRRIVHQLLVRGHLTRPPPLRDEPAVRIDRQDAAPVTPDSEQIRATVERDGLLGRSSTVGATVLANACGPCIGQWDRQLIDPARSPTALSRASIGTSPAVMTATRRRNRSSPRPRSLSRSPSSGSLDFDPVIDTITSPKGEQVRLRLRPARFFRPRFRHRRPPHRKHGDAPTKS